jgi:hypothetical protein
MGLKSLPGIRTSESAFQTFLSSNKNAFMSASNDKCALIDEKIASYESRGFILMLRKINVVRDTMLAYPAMPLC